MSSRWFAHASRVVAAVALVALPMQAVAADSKPVLRVYNWDDYLGPPEVVAGFEERFGVDVEVETFDDEDLMVSVIQSNPDKYDILITSGRLIAEMIEMRLLAPLDLSQIPNIENIDSKFRDPHYDPGHAYSVPYLWGTTAFAVSRKYVKEPFDSWAVLWNPAYAGKIAMLPSAPEVFAAALKMEGYSLNSSDATELERARLALIKQKPLLAGYINTQDVKDKLIAGELWAAQVYVGEGMVAAQENPDIQYMIPKEGATIWVDNLAIPRDSGQKQLAESFINYLLEPEVSAAISNYHLYANPNRAAQKHVLPEMLQSPALYPSKEVLDKCEVLQPVGSSDEGQRRNQIMNRIWSELQVAPSVSATAADPVTVPAQQALP